MEEENYESITIQWIVDRDIDEIMEIEEKSSDSIWTKRKIQKVLKESNCIGHVAKKDSKILGYIIYEIHDSYYEILKLVVDPKCRRQRVATMLVNRLIRRLNEKGRNSILVCIREKNLAGQLFFKKQQFTCTDILKNYYAGTNEPAYLMEIEIEDDN